MKVGTEKAAMGAVEVGVACWLTKYNQARGSSSHRQQKGKP